MCFDHWLPIVDFSLRCEVRESLRLLRRRYLNFCLVGAFPVLGGPDEDELSLETFSEGNPESKR